MDKDEELVGVLNFLEKKLRTEECWDMFFYL